jgi:sugar lactone lactonase YvrE
MTWHALTTEPNTLGESPFWHPAEQQLYWVDIAQRMLWRCNVFMGTVQTWSMPSEPGCIAPAQGGGLVIALRDGVYLAREWGGALQRLAQLDYSIATTRANDGKCDPHGRFWVGTYYEPRDLPLAALYCIDARGPGAVQASYMLRDSQVANGLAWSPDGTTLYWADTGSHVVYAWDWEGERNTLSRQRVFAQFPGKPEGWQPGQPGYGGRPDGATVDSAGNYWVAMYEGARVLQFSPAGELLADIPTPAQCPTMPCFGGADLQTLYLTTARQKRPATELEMYPQSGCVFSMRVSVPGMPANFFQFGGALDGRAAPPGG